MTDVIWTKSPEVPPVKSGAMGYYMVATKIGGKSFGAFYLNEYALTSEYGCLNEKRPEYQCPCENGDGCPSTGWFNEKESADYDGFYERLAPPVIAWAEFPSYTPEPSP